MAKIDESLFKDWNNGETINASEYKQEREIIRVAINDTDDKKTDKTGDHTGTWKGLDTSEIGDIIQSDTPPDGADEGTLWLDESDETFQGTLFEELSKGVIRQDDEPPEDVLPGQIWVDTSDNTFQGTVFDDLDTTVQSHTTQLDDHTSQLAQKVNQSDFEKNFNMLKYTKYGNITLPTDFYHNINFDIYRDIDGKMKHNFDIDIHLSRGAWKNATYIYLSNEGSTSVDGLDPANPTKTLKTALDTAHAGAETHYIIKIVSKTLDKDNSRLDDMYSITKNIAIVSDEECYIGNLNRSTGWAYTDGLCTLARSSVRSVYDTKFKDIADLPRKYKAVTSLAECSSTFGSWYYDGSLLYINRLDGSEAAPDELLPSLGTNAIPSLVFQLDADVQFIFKNIKSIHYFDGTNNIRVQSTNTENSHVILWNCSFIESGYNGFMTNGANYTWLFNTVAKETKRDGLNYHNTINTVNPSHFVFEYNCTGFDCGVNDTNNNNNCTTGHEEAHILRVNSKGWRSKGPLLADVNGCYSICYDCNFTDSVRDAHALEKTAYQFANVAFDGGTRGTSGKAIMINCEGGGEDTMLLTTAGSFSPVKVLNLKGDYTKIANTSVEFIA